MTDGQTPFVDHAAPILSSDLNLTDDDRASLWDTFAQSKDANELVKNLSGQQYDHVSNSTKQSLYDAHVKANASTEQQPDHVMNAVNAIVKLDPKVREIGETHPHLLKALVDAAKVED
jgi:hypothetical protein